MSTEGLSEDPAEYRRRLEQQADEQIDSWAGELMRDMSIRRGVLTVLEHFRKATSLDDARRRADLRRRRRRTRDRRTHRGGAPDGAGDLAALPRARPARPVPKARDQLIEFLVDGFHEVVYI